MPIVLTPIDSGGRPVTWAQAKVQLRLDDDAQQPYVESLIDAATDYAEEELSATLMQRERTATFYQAGSLVTLNRGPLVSVTSATDAKGTVAYSMAGVGSFDRLMFTRAFTPPLTVVYQAGYASADQIPASIRQAILTHVATLYENRESVSDKAKLPVPHSLRDFYRLKARKAPVG